MGSHNTILRSLLKTIVIGGDVTSLCTELLSLQARQAGWQLMEYFAVPASTDVAADEFSAPTATIAFDIIGMRETFGGDGISIRRDEENICLTVSQRDGLLLTGLLGEVYSQTADVLLRRLCNTFTTPLLSILARIFQVPAAHCVSTNTKGGSGAPSFFFVNRSGIELECELRLTGGGSFDGIARTLSDDSNIVIVDYLTESMNQQIRSKRKHWVELGATDGYKRMFTVFTYLDIPCVDFTGDLDSALDEIIPEAFDEIA